MNRVFHARITWYHYLFLILVGALAFYLLWIKAIIVAAICMVFLVFLIERSIHTTYTVTADNKLIISAGRFSKTKTIPINTILSVERGKSASFGGSSLTNFLLVQYGDGKYVSILPIKEREFMELINKRMNELNL